MILEPPSPPVNQTCNSSRAYWPAGEIVSDVGQIHQSLSGKIILRQARFEVTAVLPKHHTKGQQRPWSLKHYSEFSQTEATMRG